MARQGSRKQRFGVGMLRSAGEGARLALLDDLAEIHDRDRVAHMRHRGQIMRDEQVGEAELGLQIAEQIQDLRPDRHIERRHRLVKHDEARRQCQGPGDRDALALPAREFVREQIRRAIRQPDHVEQPQHPRAHFAARQFLVGDERFGDDGADPHARVQRGIRVLKHRLDRFAVMPPPGGIEFVQIAPLEAHDAAGRLLQPQDELRRRCFAATGLADDAEGLAALDRKRDAVDRAHDPTFAAEHAPFRREMLGEPRCLDDGHYTASRRSTVSAVAPSAGAASQQRAVRPSSDTVAGGAAWKHWSKARVQRGAKEQPGGSLDRSGGCPSIAVRRCRSSLIRGIEFSNASV